MKGLLTIGILFLGLTSVCQAQKQTKTGYSKPRVSIEGRIIDTIFSLPEVKAESICVRRLSKGKRRLSVAIYESPTKRTSYYWVKVWEDNGDSFATHFNFYVYPKELVIHYMEMDQDQKMTLKEWRRTRRASGGCR